ncbi:hypothetical protein B0H14DRAFT_154938 [Mycena olivaceomarginata]|nr:hypothetical protein B0H14DRAFT_154938 [Mycena olivaceomarginata]
MNLSRVTVSSELPHSIAVLAPRCTHFRRSGLLPSCWESARQRRARIHCILPLLESSSRRRPSRRYLQWGHTCMYASLTQSYGLAAPARPINWLPKLRCAFLLHLTPKALRRNYALHPFAPELISCSSLLNIAIVDVPSIGAVTHTRRPRVERSTAFAL